METIELTREERIQRIVDNLLNNNKFMAVAEAQKLAEMYVDGELT